MSLLRSAWWAVADVAVMAWYWFDAIAHGDTER